MRVLSCISSVVKVHSYWFVVSDRSLAQSCCLSVRSQAALGVSQSFITTSTESSPAKLETEMQLLLCESHAVWTAGLSGAAAHAVTNGKRAQEDMRHPPTSNGTTTDPTKQKAPQQPGPPPEEPKPQKQQKPTTTPTTPPSPTPEVVPPQAHANGGPPSAAAPAADAAAADPAVWTEEQQACLVRALKEISKEVPDRSATSRLVTTAVLAPQCLCTLCSKQHSFSVAKASGVLGTAVNVLSSNWSCMDAFAQCSCCLRCAELLVPYMTCLVFVVCRH